MSTRGVHVATAVLVGGLALSQPVQAQQQSVSLNVGYFSVRGEDGRIADDVLLENLNLFAFDVGDFSNGTIGGEWHVGIGEYLEAGVGVGYYRRTVPSVYNDFVNDDGSEIFQDFRLRITPLTFSLRVFPFGNEAPVQPYFGGGLGVLNWRYSEVGSLSISPTSRSLGTSSWRTERTSEGLFWVESASPSGIGLRSAESFGTKKRAAGSGSTTDS